MKRVMFISSCCLLGALISVSVIGCGDAASDVETGSDQPAAVATDDLRAQFESIAESGYAGSGISGLQAGIDALNNDAVTKEFEKLAAADAAGKQDQVRASAKKIIQSL